MRLAERLSKLSLGGKVFFTNSGAEAIECAIKLARKRRTGGGVVVLEGGFHGRTYGALSATPQETKQAPFAPLVPGFVAVPRDDPEAVDGAVDGETAAVIIEPIQGESRHPPDLRGGAARRARGMRPPRRAARVRRDPVRDGPDRRRCGRGSTRRSSPT